MTKNNLTMATICSGIGAPEVAGMDFFKPIWCSEIEPNACCVLKERFPDTINLGDMTLKDFVKKAMKIGKPDVLVAGTPCQAFSVAGGRKGLNDDRGNLTLRFVEICNRGRSMNRKWVNWPEDCDCGATLQVYTEQAVEGSANDGDPVMCQCCGSLGKIEVEDLGSEGMGATAIMRDPDLRLIRLAAEMMAQQ